MKIEGTVTISIDQYEAFKRQADELETLRENEKKRKEQLKGLIHHLGTEEWQKDIDIIDSKKYISDRQLDREVHAATMKLRVYISQKELRKVVKAYIDKNASEAHHDLKNLKMDDFMDIPMELVEDEEE